MFVYSMKASTIKFFGVICVALVSLITLIAFIPSYSGDFVETSTEVSYNYDKVKSNEDRIAFIGQFGWEVEKEALESREVTIPAEFDKVFAGYNEIQRQQGLDLSKYKKKNVMRYTYKVTNYEGYEGDVYVNLLVYRGRVVGGDVCSADVSGFVHGFEKK